MEYAVHFHSTEVKEFTFNYPRLRRRVREGEPGLACVYSVCQATDCLQWCFRTRLAGVRVRVCVYVYVG